jgi:hypothetical protein
LVRNVPAEDEAVSMTVPPAALALLLEDEAPVGVAAGAAALLLLAALLHAATSSAAPTAPPTPAASLARPGIRLDMDLPIVLISCLARPSAPALICDCQYKYGRNAHVD